MKKILVIIALLFSSAITVEASSSYIVEEKPINSVYAAKADAEQRVDYSQSVDEQRIENKSGQTALRVSTTSSNCAQNEYEVAEIVDNNIQFVGCEVYFDEAKELADDWFNDNTNGIILKNGEIIFAERAIAYTTGGYNYIGMIYPTVTEAYNSENGITISGGAYDMAYYGTTEYNGKIYYEVMVGGLHGYIDANEAELLPEEFIKSQSYYQNIDGQLVYYSTYNPLKEDAYTSMILGETNTLNEGTKYYSYDDINFSEENIYSEGPKPVQSAAMTSYTYWQWLPTRSTSNYTAQDYHDYLYYIGCNDGNPNTGATSACGINGSSTVPGQSEYYHHENGFTMAEDNVGINSTILFAMANNESAYGSSTFARNCHNFFGWGAYDSSPENACEVENGGVYFPKDDQVDDAIMAQGIHLSQSFLDAADWRFYGTHLGNKSSGMNVLYASDPNWGKTIASIAYDVDKYLAGYETGYYMIVESNAYTEFYQYSGSTSPLTITDSNGNNYTYAMKQGGTAGNGAVNDMPLLVVEEANGRYRVTLPTPIKQSSNESCMYKPANSGYAPNYNDSVNISVPTGSANYSCTYNWNSEYAWVNKSDVTMLNDVPPKNINSAFEIIELTQPIIIETNKNNVNTYYSQTITNSGTEIVASHIVYNENEVYGYIFNPNPSYSSEDSMDAIYVEDVKDISVTETANIAFTNPETLKSNNLKVYSSPSTTSTSKDTIYYDSEPVVVLGESTGESVSGNKQWSTVIYNPLIRYNGYASNHYLTSYTPTDYVGYDAKAYMDSDGVIYLNGYGYISYMNASSNESIDHSVTIKDTSGNTVDTISATDTTEYINTMSSHEKKMYNYDYSGYKLNIDLATLDLNPGTYEFYLNVDQGNEYVSVPYKTGESYSYDYSVTIDNNVYRLYSESNTLKLDVTQINPNTYVGAEKAPSLTSDGTLKLDGYAYIPYSNIPSSDSVEHTIHFVDENNDEKYSFVASDTNKYADLMSNSHENGLYEYDYSGYSLSINLPSLNMEPGTYTLNIEINSGGNTVISPLNVQSGVTFDKSVTADGYTIRVYTENNNLKIDVEKNSPQQVNSLKNISIDADGNLTLDGYAYNKTYNASSSEKINHYIKIVNTATFEEYQYQLNDSNKYVNLMNSSHENGEYNYDYSGYSGSINLMNLPNGNYQLYSVVSESGDVSAVPIALTSGTSYNKTIAKSNKQIQVYSSGSNIFINVTAVNPNFVKGQEKNPYIDNSGNLHLDGYGYIPYNYIPSASQIIHRVQFIDSSGKVVKQVEVADSAKYDDLMSSSHENGTANYTYSGYSANINLPNLGLSPGTYSIGISVSANGSVASQKMQVNPSVSVNSSITIAGVTYHLYTTNNVLMLKIT